MSDISLNYSSCFCHHTLQFPPFSTSANTPSMFPLSTVAFQVKAPCALSLSDSLTPWSSSCFANPRPGLSVDPDPLLTDRRSQNKSLPWNAKPRSSYLSGTSGWAPCVLTLALTPSDQVFQKKVGLPWPCLQLLETTGHHLCTSEVHLPIVTTSGAALCWPG